MAQAVHAASQFAVRYPELHAEWQRTSNFLVVVTVPDEWGLQRLGIGALRLAVNWTMVSEPDLNDECTAIALSPGPGARRLCAQLPLALRDLAMA